MAKLNAILSWVENFLTALALGGAAVVAIASVILRVVFNVNVFGAQEAVIYLIIFSTFVGASVTLRHGEHVSIDVLDYILGDRGRWMLAIVSVLLMVIYCAIITVYAWFMITQPAALSTVTPALKLPLWMVELPLPIGFTLLFIRICQLLYATLRRREAFPEAEDTAYGEEVT
jgi:C4-dicarboxylate transporter DctQ subunit